MTPTSNHRSRRATLATVTVLAAALATSTAANASTDTTAPDTTAPETSAAATPTGSDAATATTEAAPVATVDPELAAAVCGKEISDITVVTPYYSDQPSTKQVLDLFDADATEAGYSVDQVDTRGDLAAVNSEIENAIAQGAQAIVLGQGDPLEFGAGLDAARQANVPVFGIDAGVADGVLTNVTSDPAFLGEASAQAIIDRIGDGGKVIMIHFDPFEPVRVRAEAATALFEAHDVEILEYVQGDPADSTGFADTTVRDLLSKYPEGEVDAIWAGWDATGLGAFQATQETGRDEVVVASVDGQDFAVAEIAKDHNWIATVAQDWPAIAQAAVDAIDECADGSGPADQTIYLPGEVLNAEHLVGEGQAPAATTAGSTDTTSSDASTATSAASATTTG